MQLEPAIKYIGMQSLTTLDYAARRLRRPSDRVVSGDLSCSPRPGACR